MKKKISIVVPCFNEEANIETTYKKIELILKKLLSYDFEYIIVDNGSTDKTKEIIKRLIKRDKRIKGIFLSRNFGPEASAAACYKFAIGDAVIALPADLQDPPELILKFVKKWEQGYDVVIGIYNKTEDDLFTKFLRKFFYFFFKKISNIDVPVNASGVGLLDRKVVDALNSLPEKYRFFRGLRAWIGFKTATVNYERRKRQRGVSSYNLINYFKHAERGIFGFSYLIMDMMFYFGMGISLISLLFLVVKFSLYSLIIFIGSILLLSISIIGKYIQVIVEETKDRPMYIVEETVNYKK
ncbi:MAG: glycosyltransferase family 2 protein [Patescibacteria group bacterium]